MMIPCQRHLFDIPDDIAYFNCAYMSPLMKKVVAEGHKSVALKGQPWQISPPDFFSTPERARALFAQLINAQADDIAIIPSCSYGTATAANNLPINKGQEILVLQDQFPSHVYPWRELAADKDAEIITIPRGGNDGWTPRILAAITANIMSIRRFQRSDHKWKQPMTVVNVGIISLLVVLVIVDAAELLG